VDNQPSNVKMKINKQNAPSHMINIGESLLRKVFGTF